MVHEEAYQPVEVHGVDHLHSIIRREGRQTVQDTRNAIGDIDQRAAIRSNEAVR